MKYALSLLFILMISSSCSKRTKSLYSQLPDSQDGVIEVNVSEDQAGAQRSSQPTVILENELLEKEAKLIKKYNGGKTDTFSFLVINASTSQVLRSYNSTQLHQMASLTKLPTSIMALVNLPNPDIKKIKKILKESNNGAASQLLHETVKVMFQLDVPGKAYEKEHSCPSQEILNNEREAAGMMLDWFKTVVRARWNGAVINDGAGCDKGNLINAQQILKILQFADSAVPQATGQSFEQMLSISGVDGTWSDRNQDSRGMVLAKTGTLNTESNLAGYFYAKRDGQMHKYYFAILVQTSVGAEYIKNARSFIEGLLRGWIGYYSAQPGEAISNF